MIRSICSKSVFLGWLRGASVLVLVASWLSVVEAQSSWDQIVSSAEKEGAIVIFGQGGTHIRNGLIQGFSKKYPKIQVEYSGARGSRIASKVLTQRRAGRFLVDLVSSGPTSLVTALKPAGALDPIQKFLVGPDVQDPSKWMGGKFEFSDDDGKYLFVYLTFVGVPFVYNPDLVSSDEFTSWWDLLKPKWKGKIIISDPKVPGPGMGRVARWYLNKELGKDFIRQLFLQQDVGISRNRRQMLDWVARGRYSIALGFATGLAIRMIDKGVNIRMMDPYALKEAADSLSGSAGIMAVFNKPPHPNAVKVYLNYLLSREGQYELSKAMKLPSRRLDVPQDHLPETVYPIKQGMKIQNTYNEASVRVRVKARKFVTSILKK